MSDTGILQDDYGEDASSGIVADVNLPETPYENAVVFVARENICCGGTLGNIYWLSGVGSLASPQLSSNDPAIPSLSALSLDTKFDDGLRNTGDIHAYGFDGCGFGAGSAYGKTGHCNMFIVIKSLMGIE